MLSGSEFSVDAQKTLSSNAAKGEIRFLDVYIDHAVLSAISREYSLNPKLYASKSADVNGVSDLVALDIDAYNVLSVLRSKLWGLPESEVQQLLITPAWRVSLPALTSMAGADSVTQAAKIIESSYRFPVQVAQSDEELIDAVEDGFAKETKDASGLAFFWQGLGPGTILGLIKLLEFEVGNLSAIAIGVEANMDPKKIISRLKI